MRTRHFSARCAALVLAASVGLSACGTTAPLATAVSAGRATAGITPQVATLAVFHRHSAALPVIFSGMDGTLELRLEPPAGYASGLHLDTGSVTVSGADPTRELVVSAPGLPDFYTEDQSLSAVYTLVVSQAGRELARTPVTIEEQLLDIRTSVTPAVVSAAGGTRLSFTVVVQVTPALDGPLPVTLDGCPVEGCDYAATPVGPVTGDGHVLRQRFTMTVPQDTALPAGEVMNLHYAVALGDFAGYRRGWYGSPSVTLGWTRSP